MRFSLLTAGLLMAASVFAEDTTFDFTYNVNHDNPQYLGTRTAERYDVAIGIDYPFFAGNKITGFEVSMPGDAADYGYINVWLTSELKLDSKGVNSPDIVSVDAEIVDGKISVTFDEPYVMTEAPVYVGYSFTVTKLTETSKFPIAFSSGLNSNGLYMHTSKNQRVWGNFTKNFETGAQSAMIVKLEGQFAENSVEVSIPEHIYTKTSDEVKFLLSVTNNGINPITSFNYEWTAGEYSGSDSFSYPNGQALNPFETAEYSCSTRAFPDGKYDLNVKLTKLNGEEVSDLEASTTIVAKDNFPTHRPLVEEATGLWCGYCPYGYVMLESMYDFYSNDFVALAWHNQDAMAITNSYPFDLGQGYPALSIDRAPAIHPTTMEEPWLIARDQLTPFDINVNIEFANEEKTELKATANVTCIDDLSGKDYKIAYALVEDNMSDPAWIQANNLAGQPLSNFPNNPYFAMFAKGKSSMRGIEFSDVVLSFDNPFGIEGSLPEEIKANESYSHTYSFDLSKVRNYRYEALLQNPENLRVVAIVFDKNNVPVNCATSTYPNGKPRMNEVEEVAVVDEVVATEYYDLNGHRVAAPANGIFVRVNTMADGSKVSSKVVIK